MPFRPAALARQRFGIVRIAAGAFEDLAALDLPETLRALANLRDSEARVTAAAERLRERAFAAVRGCDDPRERRRLLKLQRDLFNGRRVDAPQDEAYTAAMADADAARETFLRSFEEGVAAARAKLHALAAAEALQRPLALSSLALLAQIGRRITRHTEVALMKYVSRMHAKTSPFSTFCHVALATFGDASAVRLREGRTSVRANRLVAESHPETTRFASASASERAQILETFKRSVKRRVRAEELFFEDSILGGEVVCRDDVTETITSYVRDLSFSDPAIARRRHLRCLFEQRYGRDAVVPLARFIDECGAEMPGADDAIPRWTAALASQLEPSAETVFIDRQHVDYAFSAVPELRRETPRSVGAMLQFSAEGIVLNNCGPGHGKFVSRFLDLLPPETLEEQRAINGKLRLVEVRDDSRLNMNIHPQLVDGEIGDEDVADLTVKIGNDDTLWLVHRGARIEVVDLGLQARDARSPLHQFLNAVFSPAEQILRKPMVRAALAVAPPGVMKPRVVYDRRLIIRRRSWTVEKPEERTNGESDAAFFARIDAWRRSLGMPRYVFVKDGRKPQFISFASWHSVMLFERIKGPLKIREMLPMPADMLAWNGKHHAAEFVLQWNRSE